MSIKKHELQKVIHALRIFKIMTADINDNTLLAWQREIDLKVNETDENAILAYYERQAGGVE